MNAPVKLILGAVAAGCIGLGVAAQTSSVTLPRLQQQTVPRTQNAEPTPLANATPAHAATPTATPGADGDGGDEGD